MGSGDPKDSQEVPASTGYFFYKGSRITWHYTTESQKADCLYCQEGYCEQRVELGYKGGGTLTVHDRPRWLH